MRPHGSAHALEQRRKRAIDLLSQGHPPVVVARRVGVDRRSVRRWQAAYRAHGEAGIQARPAPGAPSKLSPQQKQQLEHALCAGAQANGFSTDLWTCRRVAALIQRLFGVSYHIDHVGRLLHALGWTPQKPQRRAVERDEDQIQHWIKNQWPRIKKKRRA